MFFMAVFHKDLIEPILYRSFIHLPFLIVFFLQLFVFVSCSQLSIDLVVNISGCLFFVCDKVFCDRIGLKFIVFIIFVGGVIDFGSFDHLFWNLFRGLLFLWDHSHVDAAVEISEILREVSSAIDGCSHRDSSVGELIVGGVLLMKGIVAFEDVVLTDAEVGG